MGEKQALTEFKNKRLMKKIGRLEQEILELKNKIVAQEKVRGRKNSAKKKKKKSKILTEQSPQRSSSKKTNCESKTGLDNEKAIIPRCFSKSSGKGLLESIKVKDYESDTGKIKAKGLVYKRYRSGSKDFSCLDQSKDKKKHKICKTCLKLMNKGYSTRFCPTHGSYSKSIDKASHL